MAHANVFSIQYRKKNAPNNWNVVVNKEGLNPQDLNWEYYCTGKNGLLTNDAWGSINGFTSEKKVVFVTTIYTHPALSDNEDGSYLSLTTSDLSGLFRISEAVPRFEEETYVASEVAMDQFALSLEISSSEGADLSWQPESEGAYQEV